MGNNFNDNDIDDGIQLLSVCDSTYDNDTITFMYSEDNDDNKNGNENENKKNDGNDTNNKLKQNYHEIMPVSWKLVSYMINLCLKLDCCDNWTTTSTTTTSTTKHQNLQCNVSDDITPIVGNISTIKKKERSTNTKTTNTTITTTSNTTNSNDKRDSSSKKSKLKGYKNNNESIET